MRVGWALCVALAAGGCRASALDSGSPDRRVSAGGDAAAAADGGGARTAAGAPTDAGSLLQSDDAAAPDGATLSMTGACIPASSTVVRLLAPQSGSTVTSAAPRFRWTGGTGPYRLQVCADRSCTRVVVEVTSVGTETTLPQAIPAGYWFWRVQDVGGAVPSWTSPWETRVRRRFPGYAPVANTSVSGFSDYNGDGYPDVAATYAAPMVYLGGPDGFSASRVWQSDQNSALGIALIEPQVDVNGDGFTDLSSSEGQHAAHIQFGGRNGFASFVDVPSGGAYDQPIGLGDFYGDGFGVLIMQSRYAAAFIRVCAPAAPNAVPAYLDCGNCQLQQVATGDFDGDGRSDFIFADATEISLYMGGPNSPAPIRISGMSGLSVVDFNYDGYSDLVIRDEWPADTLHAYEGGPNGLSSTLSTAAQPTQFALVGDFDGDGYWDTLGPGCGTDGCSVAYGGPGGWGALATRTTPVDVTIIDFAGVPDAIVVDLNADGYDDLLVEGTTTPFWYAGSPSGLSTAPTRILTP